MNTPEKTSLPTNEPLEGLLKDAVRAVRQSTPPPGFGAKLLAEAATWKHPVSIKQIAPPASRNPLIMLITASIAASLFFIWFTGDTRKKQDLTIASAPELQSETRRQKRFDDETLHREETSRKETSREENAFSHFGAQQANLGMKRNDGLTESFQSESNQLQDLPKSAAGAKDTIADSETKPTEDNVRSGLEFRSSKEQGKLDAADALRPAAPRAPGEGSTGSRKSFAPPANSQAIDEKFMRDNAKESKTKNDGAEKNDPSKPAKLESIAAGEPKADFDHGKLNAKQPEAKQEVSNAPSAAPMGRSRTEAGGVAGALGGRGFGGGGGPGSSPTPDEAPAMAKKKAQSKTELHGASDAPIDKMATRIGGPPRGGPPSGGPAIGNPAPDAPGRGGPGGKAAEIAMNRKPGDATAPVIRSVTPASTAPKAMPPPGPIGAGAKLASEPTDRASGADQAPRFAIADKATMFFSILSDKSTELGKPADLSGANLLQSWNWSERESILLGDIAADPIAASPDGKKVYSANGTLFDVELKELKQYRELGDNVRGLTVSPDGKRLLTQHVEPDTDCYFRLSDLSDVEKKLDLPNQWGYTFAAGFSPDNTALALMDKEKIVHEYRLTDGVLLKTYAPAHVNSIRAIEYSPDGKLLASTGTRGETYLWNRETSKLEHELKITQTPPEQAAHGLYSMKFSPDSKFLAASGSSKIFFWNTATGEVAAQLGQGSGQAIYLRYSSDGKKLTAITNLTTAKGGEGKEETKSPAVQEWDVPEQAR